MPGVCHADYLGPPVMAPKQAHGNTQAGAETPEVRMHDEVLERAAPLMHLHSARTLSQIQAFYVRGKGSRLLSWQPQLRPQHWERAS